MMCASSQVMVDTEYFWCYIIISLGLKENLQQNLHRGLVEGPTLNLACTHSHSQKETRINLYLFKKNPVLASAAHIFKFNLVNI